MLAVSLLKIWVLEFICEKYEPGTSASDDEESCRSENGSAFISRILWQWLAQGGVKALYIDSGCPWQNGYVECCNGSLRGECLDREFMLSVAEARVLIEDYRRHYKEEKPHGGIVSILQPKPALKLLAPSTQSLILSL